jgi:hypothetical protein
MSAGGDGLAEPVVAPVTEAADRTPFMGRASNLLLVLGMAAVGVALFLVVPSNAAFSLRMLAGGLTIATGAAMLLTSFALDRHRPWAPATAAAVLWIVLLMGLVRAVTGILGGGIWVPLDAIAAVWALSAAGRPVARPRGSALAWALVGLVLIGRVGEPVVGALFTPGTSAFAVAASELKVQLVAACPSGTGTAGAGAGAAGAIPVDGSWAWAKADLFPSGTDGIGIGWTASDGGPWSYEVRDVLPAGYLTKGGGGASGGVVGRELAGVTAGTTWAVDVDNGGLIDGKVALDLVPPWSNGGDRPQSGTLTIRMVYAHLDRWVVAAETTCTW